jgi:hypothetical protein
MKAASNDAPALTLAARQTCVASSAPPLASAAIRQAKVQRASAAQLPSRPACAESKLRQNNKTMLRPLRLADSSVKTALAAS